VAVDYTQPQVQVFQEFNASTNASVEPLPAHISGGHAHLIRYSETDEKDNGSLGQYNHNSEQSYLWPNRPAGSIVDRSYTKLFIDDALLHYWDSSDAGDTVGIVNGYRNRVRAAVTAFADNGADHPHDSDTLLDRGAKVGDVVRVRATVDGDSFELCTYVAGFVGEVIAATIGEEVTDDNNADAASAAQSVERTDGVENCITVDIHGSSTYNGLAGGHPEETYVVTVVSSSVDGDATTATLRVRSASGTDDADDVVPGAFGAATTIGSRGVKLVFDVDAESGCESVSEEADVASDELVAGQEYTVTASMNYTTPGINAAGTYTGTKDDTYIVKVTRGKSASLNPQISVSTIRGLDISGPTTISSTSTAYSAGSKGLTVQFSSLNLNKGDKWYVPVVASGAGDYQTLVLGNNLADEVIDDGGNVVVDLYIRKNIQVSANRIGSAPLTNWGQSATELTVEDGITAYDSSWTDEGTPVALPVQARCDYSNLFVETRYWLPGLSAKVTEVGSSSELGDLVSGALHPDNPLKYAALKALENSNGTPVSLTAVCDPSDVDQWASVLEILDGRRGIYGLVPLTKDPAVWSIFKAHVETQSSPENGRWRALWLNSDTVFEKVIVDETKSSDEDVVLAVLEDDPNTSGTQYTQLRVPAHNAKFVTNEVRPGDIVRFEYTGDGFGNESYTELIVDAVLNEDTIRLASGLDSAVSVAERVEVYRNLSAAEQSTEIALTGGFGSRRVRFVWPDTFETDGYEAVEGYHLCAILAGLSSGVVPHQGLTNLEISGITSVKRTTEAFSRANLNTMAAGGVWVVTQSPSTGAVFTRHALTTSDVDSVDEREEMVTRNLDSISFFFLDRLAPYIGTSNVTPSCIDQIRTDLLSGINLLGNSNFVNRLGPQLITGTITDLRAHASERDRLVASIDMVVPAPLNNIELHLVLVA
jgi:hypothetical protein